MKQKIICFDVDGTLTTISNVWAYLGENFGVEDPNTLTEIMQSELDRTAKLKAVINELRKTKNCTRENLLKTYEKFPVRDNISELFIKLKELDYKIFLVTGGPKELAEIINDRYKLDGIYFIAEWEFDDDGLIKMYHAGDALKQGAKKVEYVNKISGEHLVQPIEIYFVGDSTNDLAAFKHTGNGILIETNATTDELRMASRYRINDLLDIINIVDGE